jgi:hypothetical protein
MVDGYALLLLNNPPNSRFNTFPPAPKAMSFTTPPASLNNPVVVTASDNVVVTLVAACTFVTNPLPKPITFPVTPSVYPAAYPVYPALLSAPTPCAGLYPAKSVEFAIAHPPRTPLVNVPSPLEKYTLGFVPTAPSVFAVVKFTVAPAPREIPANSKSAEAHPPEIVEMFAVTVFAPSANVTTPNRSELALFARPWKVSVPPRIEIGAASLIRFATSIAKFALLSNVNVP